MRKVRAIFDFEFNDEDFSEEFVDINGLAEDCLKEEMKSLIETHQISEDDFRYVASNANSHWESYCEYLIDWANNHRFIAHEGECPVSYKEWLDNERREENT